MRDDTQSDPVDATGHAEESVNAPTFASTHNKITITVESSEGTFSIEFYAQRDKTEFTTESYPSPFDEDESFLHRTADIIRTPRPRKHILGLTSYPVPHPETGIVYLKRTTPAG